MNKIFAIIVVTLIPTISFGQNSQKERLDSLFTALYTKQMFNGNVLIAENGFVAFQKSYGIADEETKRKLNDSTIFELASVSKQFTAMAIVLLKKQGKLTYEDAISKYIPEMNFYENISIRDLLNHTSGLPDYMELFDANWDKTKFATNQDIVDEFVKHKPELVFQPGEKFEYSNTGYALLALIIEKVSKQSFGQFLNTNIFQPLGMKNTLVYRSRYEPRQIENYALGYESDSLGNKVLLDSFGKEYFTYYLDGIVGDGMVNSSTSDLLIWDRALYSDKLISSSDKDIIFTPGKNKDGKETNYGLGWAIRNYEKYGKVVNHSGGWAGYITLIERHLDNDKTIIILQNNSTQLTQIPVRDVRKILYNEPLTTDNLESVILTSEELDKYTGEYSNENVPFKIKIFKNENRLMAQADGQNSIPLDSYKDHTFKFDPAEIKLVFDTAKKEMTLFQGDVNLIFKKR